MKLPKLIVILGPTASGKTDLAIKLARNLALSKIEGFDGAEIISADSRQVYKEMKIGTAKPTKKELKGIPYYLIDIVSPKKDFNVAVYKNLAIKKIKQIHKKGKIPLLVGGTALYAKAVIDNINFPKVIPNKKLRRDLEEKTEKELFKIYKNLDPQGSKFIDKNNRRRLIRAIEVCKITGDSFWRQRKKQKPIFDILQIGIKINKSELNRRIEKRIKIMFKLGLEKEVKNLVKKYGWIVALQTIGYQEFKEYFEGKIKTEEKLKELIKVRTFQFVKRQMTWFKKEKRIRWIKSQKEAEKLIKSFLK